MSCYISPHQVLLGNFRGISHHTVPPHGFVTLWKRGAYSFVPYPQIQPLPIPAHSLKMQIPQVAMALRIYRLKITDTRREKGGHLRREDFYFCLSFFARALARGAAPLPVRADSVCLSGLGLRKRAMRLVSRAILALLYFTKQTNNPFTSSFSAYLTRGAQRATWTHQVDLFSHHHLSSKVTVSGK